MDNAANSGSNASDPKDKIIQEDKENTSGNSQCTSDEEIDFIKVL